MTRPLLSILIPTYVYPLGLERILQALGDDYSDELELLVFDDSPYNEIQELVSLLASKSKWTLRYQHNKPALGPAANWNALLDAAQGEYCLLLHHDEFPLGSDFVTNVLKALRQDTGIDVLILDSVLISPSTGSNRRHLPNWLRNLVINSFPEYLFRRNVIGPTATLVFRRSLSPRFDARLRWFIDVDFYVRLLMVAKNFRLCPEIQIGSVMDRANSITAGLRSSIPQIAREERIYLKEVHQTTSLWLESSQYKVNLRTIILVCETICWNSIRGIGRILAAFCSGPVPQAVARQAINLTSLDER